MISKSIIKTLSYSDIFEFPLTRPEIYKYYIGDKVERGKLYKVLNNLVEEGIIEKKSNYYFLNNKKNNYSKRLNRTHESNRKMKIAKNYAMFLGKIPTIKLIGISGSLSMKNCERRDDIDLFFITSKNTLWMTRMIVNILLMVKGAKRARLDNFGIDRICPNMFVAEDKLNIDRNLFTAHEISQLKVVVDKDQAYKKFITNNSWVKKYMPNSIPSQRGKINFYIKGNKILGIIDKAFFIVQYLYMKKRITIENVSKNRAAFHPKDKTYFVIELYKNKYKTYQKLVFSSKKSQPQNVFDLASNYTPGY